MDEAVTQDEIAKVQEAFSLFDKDGDGCVTTRELGPVLRSVGLNPSETEITQLAEEFDPEGTGSVEFSDFLQMIGKVDRTGGTEDDLEEAFRVFDKDGSGKISIDELRHIMTNKGEKLSDEQVDEMMDTVEVDSQRDINYKDFIKLMLSDQ